MEISLVDIPADPTVGVGRSAEDEHTSVEPLPMIAAKPVSYAVIS